MKLAGGIHHRHKAGHHAENRREGIRSVNVKIGKRHDICHGESKNTQILFAEAVTDELERSNHSGKAHKCKRHPEEKGNSNIKNS